MLVPHTAASACSSWLPTPTASQFTRNKSLGENAKVRLSLTGMARKGQWPDDCQDRGQLNPEFVEWLMGFAIGHTDSEP